MNEANVTLHSTKNSNQFELKTNDALIQLLLKQINPSAYANLVLLTVAAVVVYTFKNEFFIIWWLVLGYAFTGLRLLVLFKFKQQNSLVTKVERIIMGLLLLSGLHWAVLAWLYLDPNQGDIFPFLSALFLGIVTATIPSIAPRPNAWFVYIVPISLSVIAKFFFVGQWAMAVMSILGLALVTQVIRNLNEKIKYSITQEFRNAELLEEVSLAKDTAEKANLAKSKFLASASHDLRQPLHVQSLLLEVLALRLTDEENKDLLAKITQSNSALNELFNALLEISQLDAGTLKVHLSHHHLDNVVQSLLDEYRLLAQKKGLLFKVDIEPCVIVTDLVLFKRILSNLLSNALKFTESGVITVTAKRINGTVELTVMDTGIGIDPSQHDMVFEEYVQIGNQARDRSKGIGLGLSLVARLCDMLGHKIELTSQLLKGAEFKLTLKKGISSRVFTDNVEINHDQINNINVLLIDDEKEIVDAMTLILDKWGARVNGVQSIQAAMDLIENKSYLPDIIISDYRLTSEETGLDGLSLIQNKIGKSIPSLLITGDTNPQILERINKQGLYILHKPVKAQHLKKVINILLKEA